MTLVSVVVPFLDAGRHLSDAIASVQAQTWTEWELLLVDDGSTDASGAIAAAAAASDDRIRVLTRPPGSAQGAAAARNVGLRAARGDVVAFLDADDVFEPSHLSSKLRALDAHPDAMVVYGPTRWWHPGAEHLDWTEDVRSVAGRVHRPPTLCNRVVLMQRGHVPCTCGVLVRREALDQVGGFAEDFHLYEDQTLWVKLMLRFPVVVTDVVGARYRQHDASATARSERAGVYDRLGPHEARTDFLRWVREHARAAGLADASVERALRVALAPYERGPLTLGDRSTLAGLAVLRARRRAEGAARRALKVVRARSRRAPGARE